MSTPWAGKVDNKYTIRATERYWTDFISNSLRSLHEIKSPKLF